MSTGEQHPWKRHNSGRDEQPKPEHGHAASGISDAAPGIGDAAPGDHDSEALYPDTTTKQHALAAS